MGGQRQRNRRVLVVRVEAQTLPAVTQAVRESRAQGVGGTGGAVVVVSSRLQLIQRHRGDGGPVHGEGVAGIAGEMRERVRPHHRAHVHLRTILLTAVILQRREED